MISDVHVLRYGRAATTALRAAIDLAKASSPLAPVTVIVPSNFAGLAARRVLGSGIVGKGGIANVSFVTPFRLAELVAAGAMPDRRPLTNPVLGAAVRAALAESDTIFASVADHLATERAVASAYAELSNVDEALLGDVASHNRTARAAVELCSDVRQRLSGYHEEADVANAAMSRLDEQLDQFGHLIWFLPDQATPPIARFLTAAFERNPTTVIIGTSGDAEADRVTERTCEAVGVRPSQIRGGGTFSSPLADHLFSVTDADEEVREAARRIVGLAESGVPLDRIGVFYTIPDPYVRLIEQQLGAAGLLANGPSPRRLAESAVGRTLLDALQLPARRWRRDRVMALVSGAPLRFEGAAVRPSVWEHISRAAGVVQDRSDWARKLGAYHAKLNQDLADAEQRGERSWRIEQLQRALNDTQSLANFITELEVRVTAITAAKTWDDKATATKTMLEALLGPEHTHGFWPEAEKVALERISDAIVRLGTLDDFDAKPSSDVFVRALTTELDVARNRSGRFGEGVTYGPLSTAPGQDLDAVFILGCLEGFAPGRRRDDPLLPDGARIKAVGQLTTRQDRLNDQHRCFLAALAAAPPGDRTLSYPRGDLRSGHEGIPSRWLLDSASALARKRVLASDIARLDESVVEALSSHTQRVTEPPVPLDVIERDVAAVSRFLADGGDLSSHPVGELIATGLEALIARRSAAFTKWDGNVSERHLEATGSKTLSASRLETWASCGFKYFLGYVLGLSEREDPERIIDINPLDRGSAVHEALELFIAEVIEAGAPDPSMAWTEADRERLQAIAIDAFDQFERRGRTGREVLWRQTKRDLLEVLDDFLTKDQARRAATGGRPSEVELAFGMRNEPPLNIELPDGRRLQFRGMVDRLDLASDGTAHVYDYKTGKGRKYEALKDDDFGGGTMLQLGLYAEAVRGRLGDPSARVSSNYWMVDPSVNGKLHGYEWTEDRRDRLVELLTAIVEGIDGGVYPGVPGEWNSYRSTHDNCNYCDFDSVCPVARGDQASEKAHAVELRVRDRLVPPSAVLPDAVPDSGADS